jgi:hypothetical protein
MISRCVAAVSPAPIRGLEVSTEPEVAYSPDPELDFVIGDAEALMLALMDGPVLVAGNGFIN